MNDNTGEIFWKLLKAWKTNTSILVAFILWVIAMISLSLGIDFNQEKWYQSANVYAMFLCCMILFILYGYIAYKRCYIHKAKNNTLGILFCISYSDERQFKIVNDKFIKPFKAMINQSTQLKNDVVILNDYVSSKYNEKFEISQDKDEIQKKLLKTANCKMLLWGNCLACGDGEKTLCKITLEGGIAHKKTTDQVNKILKKEFAAIFSPLREIYISKENETKDFASNAETLGYIFKYIIGTTNLFCGNAEIAIENFKELQRSISLCKNISDTVIRIKNNDKKRIGICYITLAQMEYEKFRKDRETYHLEKAKKYLSNSEISEVNHNTDVLKAICFFKVDRDANKALSCLEKHNSGDPAVKINIAFLKLYKSGAATNIVRAYQAYKVLDKVTNDQIAEIGEFVHEEYKLNDEKFQLLFLLSALYVYQGDYKLAKYYYNQFFEKCGELAEAKSLKKIFDEFEEKFKDIVVKEDEIVA